MFEALESKNWKEELVSKAFVRKKTQRKAGLSELQVEKL